MATKSRYKTTAKSMLRNDKCGCSLDNTGVNICSWFSYGLFIKQVWCEKVLEPNIGNVLSMN